ncbi:28764_t:CDS:2 [Gigaspora margarita]|uniref:28764_t:CDS:1 n=1 Tax=Gigaspora margarita TaxID=4874 RepID=A0ABN7V1K1_GIGMA|nr:28764_t:CDS:2 [Gigaspora margarita]
MDKDTNRFKNSSFHRDKADNMRKKNGIEIEEQIIYPRKLSQKENIRRDQPVNEQAHLKRPYQALNNIRSLEKDQNKRSISQYNHHKRFQKSKEVNAQPVESVDLDLQVAKIINMKMITENDHGTPLINLDLKTLSIDKYNWAQKISKEK